ncbi:hypothetical protein E0485_13650 [Paenibacillus albiflavus]|uniref:Uncharacterized protein n=1 Tax=Paenibacillus albiflavus TaxID=2545760 RepID=A0A4R4ECC9_9BACL|nr:hypothetical protein E0485_13650 [Paenibacillus albiflavus]
MSDTKGDIMANLDPQLMRTFRNRCMNPLYFGRVYGILSSHQYDDLKDYGKCCGMINRLSDCLGVPVTPDQRENAVQWLMNCCIDPQNRCHRRQMWRLLHRGI